VASDGFEWAYPETGLSYLRRSARTPLALALILLIGAAVLASFARGLQLLSILLSLGIAGIFLFATVSMHRILAKLATSRCRVHEVGASLEPWTRVTWHEVDSLTVIGGAIPENRVLRVYLKEARNFVGLTFDPAVVDEKALLDFARSQIKVA
jgi:hypothetical protein